jgi:hypothetical protein
MPNDQDLACSRSNKVAQQMQADDLGELGVEVADHGVMPPDSTRL